MICRSITFAHHLFLVKFSVLRYIAADYAGSSAAAMDHSGLLSHCHLGEVTGASRKSSGRGKCDARPETDLRKITNSFFCSANSQTIILIEAPLTFRHVQVAAMAFASTLVPYGRLTVRSSPTPSMIAGTNCGELTRKHLHTDTFRYGLVHWSGRC